MMEEALEAGNILGIHIDIGIEFSAMVCGLRCHFMAELPHMGTRQELRQFFTLHENDLGEFFHGLDINRENRLEAVRQMLDNFNRNVLPRINQGFEEKPEYCLSPLSLEELLAAIPNVSITPLHLAEFIYLRYRPVLQRRVWYYKVLREEARHLSAVAKKRPTVSIQAGIIKEKNLRKRRVI